METITGSDSTVFTQSAASYIVDGCVGVTEITQRGVRLALETSAGFNLILRNVLPYGWKDAIDTTQNGPELMTPIEKHLNLQELVCLTMRFRSSLYLIKFMVANSLDFEEIFGTAFMNRHFDSIMYQEQKI